MHATTSDAKSIFGHALDIASPAERAKYLDQACAQDAGLRAEVEALIGAIGRAGNFLVPTSSADQPTFDHSPSERIGTMIGPYKLLEQIGEGGMGLVYMAQQTAPVKRKVALKIIKPGMDTRQVIARFEAERQALALMDHPNIAKVLDAGTVGVGPGRRTGPEAQSDPEPQGPAGQAPVGPICRMGPESPKIPSPPPRAPP